VTDRKEHVLSALLRQIKEVLDEQSVEFWLECGTLLGAVREKEFISWENDIDLGTWNKNVSENLKEDIACELRNRTMKVHIFENYMNIRKGKAHVDIKFYRLSEDNAIEPKLAPRNLAGKLLSLSSIVFSAPDHYEVDFRASPLLYNFTKSILIIISRLLPSAFIRCLAKMSTVLYAKFGAKDATETVPNGYFTDLSTIRFYGMEFKIPAKTKEYLAYRYGKDWRIPRRDWITSRDDGAVLNQCTQKS